MVYTFLIFRGASTELLPNLVGKPPTFSGGSCIFSDDRLCPRQVTRPNSTAAYSCSEAIWSGKSTVAWTNIEVKAERKTTAQVRIASVHRRPNRKNIQSVLPTPLPKRTNQSEAPMTPHSVRVCR